MYHFVEIMKIKNIKRDAILQGIPQNRLRIQENRPINDFLKIL